MVDDRNDLCLSCVLFFRERGWVCEFFLWSLIGYEYDVKKMIDRRLENVSHEIGLLIKKVYSSFRKH